MRTILLSLAFALALAIPAGADACVPGTSEADITLGVRHIGTIYGDDVTSCSSYTLEGCQARVCDYVVGGTTCIESAGWMMWWYQESNGLPGLQRQDESWDDTCRGLVDGDTVLY